MKYDVFVGYHADNVNKQLVGTCCTAMVEINTKRKFFETYSATDSYMIVCLATICDIFELVDSKVDPELADGSDMTINFYIAEKNVRTIVSKVLSVYASLIGITEDVELLIDRKLLRSNMQRHPHHNIQKKMVEALLSLNKKLKLVVRCNALHSDQPSMRTAYQKAAISLEKHN